MAGYCALKFREQAQPTFQKIVASNRRGLFIATLPYKIGIFSAVTAAFVSLPMIFDINTVLWFNEIYVTSGEFFLPFFSFSPLLTGKCSWRCSRGQRFGDSPWGWQLCLELDGAPSGFYQFLPALHAVLSLPAGESRHETLHVLLQAQARSSPLRRVPQV